MSRPRVAGALARHAASMALAFVFVLPLAWMVVGSLRQTGLPQPRGIEWLPNPIAWDNYRRIFEILPLGRYALNSLLVAGLAVPLTLLTASWAGLSMALAGPRWRRRWLGLALGLLLVPASALWLPRFLIFTWLRLTNSYAALLAPVLLGSSPLFVLLYYWSFRRVPPEIFESARLDGAGPLSLWRRVALPLARPTSAAVAILTFWLYWSDYLGPLLYLKSEALYTLPLGVRLLQQMARNQWPLLLAAAVLMTAPPVALFLVGQRFLLSEVGVGKKRA